MKHYLPSWKLWRSRTGVRKTLCLEAAEHCSRSWIGTLRNVLSNVAMHLSMEKRYTLREREREIFKVFLASDFLILKLLFPFALHALLIRSEVDVISSLALHAYKLIYIRNVKHLPFFTIFRWMFTSSQWQTQGRKVRRGDWPWSTVTVSTRLWRRGKETPKR